MNKTALIKRCLMSSLIIIGSLLLLDPYFTFSNSLIVFAGLIGFVGPYVLLKPLVRPSNGTNKKSSTEKR